MDKKRNQSLPPPKGGTPSATVNLPGYGDVPRLGHRWKPDPLLVRKYSPRLPDNHPTHPDSPRRHGNRCGHDPRQLRGPVPGETHLAHGHLPAALRETLDRIAMIPRDNRILKSWHRHNGPRRGRRSEIREICSVALWTYFANWVALETRMVGVPGQNLGEPIREVPTVKQIASQATRAFPGKKFSETRIRRLLWELEDHGYIKSHKQVRIQLEGTWVAKPKVFSFTKRFFVDLGGAKLWKHVRTAGQAKWRQIERRLLQTAPDIVPRHATSHQIDLAFVRYISTGMPYSTRELYRLHNNDPPEIWRRLLFPHLAPAS